MKTLLRVLLPAIWAFTLLVVGAQAQEPARYKQIVVRVVSRALDKAHPDILSDTGCNVNARVLATDAPPVGGYADHSLGNTLKFGVTHELHVYYRPNSQPVAVAVVSGAAEESGTPRTLFGIGLGPTPAAAEHAAVADLTVRHPGWTKTGTSHRVVSQVNYPAGEELSKPDRQKLRVMVTIPWNYVPAVSPSAQTELGYAVALSTEYPVEREAPGWLAMLLPDLDEADLLGRNLRSLEKLRPFKDTRSVSGEWPVGTAVNIVVVSATIPTPKGPVLRVYGAGVAKSSSGQLNDPSDTAALDMALKNLAGHSWGWSKEKHGYKVEYERQLKPPRLGSFGIRG